MNEKLQKRLDDMERRYIARYSLVKKAKQMSLNQIENNIQLIKDYSAFMKKGIKLFLK